MRSKPVFQFPEELTNTQAMEHGTTRSLEVSGSSQLHKHVTPHTVGVGSLAVQQHPPEAKIRLAALAL